MSTGANRHGLDVGLAGCGASAVRYSYRSDPQVPSFLDDRPVFIFDGHCGLCSGWVKLILCHDRTRHYRLLAAQSVLGQALYVHYGLDPINFQTIILLADGLPFVKAEGAIKLAVGLGFPWSLAAMFRVLPWRLADVLYDWVARNRFRLFGYRSSCYLPQPADRDRFLA